MRELAPGRRFIDVGGMWNIDGEIALLAAEAGAERVVLFDAMEESEAFHAERERRDLSVTCIRGDLHDAAGIAELGQFDVVWCTGVVYHSPNPFDQLRNLRSLCSGTLVLGSHVIPELPGIEQACVWYPGTSEGTRRAFRRAHGGERAPSCLGVTEPFDPAPGMEYANYWWGITPSALRAMTETAGFEVTEERSYTPFLTDLVARAGDGG